MKLFELINPASKDEEKEALTTFVKGLTKPPELVKYKDKSFNILGVGVEAVAYETKDDPEIIKIFATGFEELKSIPYLQYILTLSKYAKENPYFPRANIVKQVSFNKAEYEQLAQQVERDTPRHRYHFKLKQIPKTMFTVKMERLEHGQKAEYNELEYLWNKLFENKIYKRTAMSEDASAVWDQIANFVSDATNGSPDVIIKDPLLKKAIDLIRKVRKNTKGDFDIHINNLMIRRTPHGIQLVLSDPLIGSK